MQALAIDHYWGIVKRRKWVLFLPIILGVLGTLAASIWLPNLDSRTYEASATARLALAGRSLAGLPPVDPQETQRLVSTSLYMLQTDDSLTKIIKSTGSNATSDELRRRIHVEPITGTELVKLSAQATTPSEAQAIANALADAWPQEAAEFYNRVNSPQLASSFAAVERASLPEVPVGIGWSKRIGIGLLMGTLAGVCLALTFDYTDRTINVLDDLKAIPDVPVLSTISQPSIQRKRLTPQSLDTLDSPESRLLTVKLFRMVNERKLTSLLFTSGFDDEAATGVAISASLGLARNGVDVMLLDAQLTKPSLSAVFDLPPSHPGLTDLLSSIGDSTDVSVVLDKTRQESHLPSLSVITGGSPVPDAWSLLGSLEMRQLIEYHETLDSLMVIDGPPLASADGFTLASLVSGVILVCSEGKTTSDELQRNFAQLKSLGANVLGVVYKTKSHASVPRQLSLNPA